MAGIEKVCEFSGEYPGWLMYGYKRNLIQIMPKFRKLFRGADHTIYIFRQGKQWVSKWGGSSSYNPTEWEIENEWGRWDPPFKDEQDYIKFRKDRFKERLLTEYYYVLKVTDPKLQGEVRGKYLNWTTELPSVKRRLKRLLRRPLNVKYIDMNYNDWVKENKNDW